MLIKSINLYFSYYRKFINQLPLHLCAIPSDWKEANEVDIISAFPANLFLHYMLDKWLKIWFC